MKVAVVGAGIAGNVVAYELRRDHEVTVYEAAGYIGGHTNTVEVGVGKQRFAVDTGFIVFNDWTYPSFSALLDELGVESQPSSMSFSVSSERTGVEYNGTSLAALFAQRRNLFRPKFHRMLLDIVRFNRDARAWLEQGADMPLCEFLADHGYGEEFVVDYLVPMTAAIWSAAPGAVRQMPARFLFRFFANHGMLSIADRPQWRTIRGGSARYVEKLVAGHRERIRLRCPVVRIERGADGVRVFTSGADPERFDAVFLACHSDTALRLLGDADAAERTVLGALRYRSNDAVLHTDTRLLPKCRRAWASWNYRVPHDEPDRPLVTYRMNELQRLGAPVELCVTLNDAGRIRPEHVIERYVYDHPVFDSASVSAQRRQAEIDGPRRTYFCGAYWGNGFHEDGVVSAKAAVRHFNERLAHAQPNLRRAG